MLDVDKYMVKEQVKFLKSHSTYDIFDFDSEELVGTAEEIIPGWVQALRWFLPKSMMPTKVVVRDDRDEKVFTIKRDMFFFQARVEVLNASGEKIGYFKNKIFSFGGGFWVYDQTDKQFAEVKGNFFGFNYKVVTPDGHELGKVTKTWGGMARELFTSADTYMVDVADDLVDQPVAKILVLASALAIDVIFKSEKRGGFEVG